MKKDPKYIEIHKHASNNEIEILKSTTCSCFFCRQSYSARTVNDWINDDRGVTAICPECGMDAVIGDASGYHLDKAELKEMNLEYYGEDYMEKHPAAAEKYVKRYKEGKITHKQGNEALYIQYLFLLASKGNGDAAFDLAQLYENGSEFTQPDPKVAFSYYAMNCLSKDGSALTRLGVLSESGALGQSDPRGAFECYCKAMAMGSLEGLIHYADCYAKGTFVQPDQDFAFEVLSGIWDESYRRFVATNGKDINIFPEISFRLGKAFNDGQGVRKDNVVALRLFLFAEFGYNLLQTSNLLNNEAAAELAECENRIAALAKLYHLQKQDPVFDNDTFADSFEVELEAALPLQSYLFAPGNFDRSQNLFDFDISYVFPPLIVDCGNLYCGFVPGTVHWSFTDVADVKYGNNLAFDRITGNPDDGWSFINGTGSDEETVGVIVFTRGPAKPHHHEERIKGKA